MTESTLSPYSFFNIGTNVHIRNLDADTEHTSNIITEYNSSPASDFNQGEKDNIAYELNTFHRFIKSRIQYLDTLHFLGDNWISEKSFQPNAGIILAGKILLRSIYNWVCSFNGATIFIPDIVMGPIPSGGLTFEIKIPSSSIIYLSIYNNGNSDIEICDDGYYFDFKGENDNYLNDIINLLSFYGIRRDNSRWRNAF